MRQWTPEEHAKHSAKMKAIVAADPVGHAERSKKGLAAIAERLADPAEMQRQVQQKAECDALAASLARQARERAERKEADRLRKAQARQLERLRKGTLREKFSDRGKGRPSHMDFPHWVPFPMRPEYEDRARQWGEEHAAAWARKEKRLLMYAGG